MYATDKYLHLLGGVDINPQYYNQQRNPFTQTPNRARDAAEFLETRKYMEAGLPIIGVCRGAQLLCIAHGGQLWQDSEGHDRNHDLVTVDGIIHDAPAAHHQIMDLRKIPAEDYEILAAAPFFTKVYGERIADQEVLEESPEVVWFPKTKCLAIQPHPEWTQPGDGFLLWINKVIEERLGFKDFF